MFGECRFCVSPTLSPSGGLIWVDDGRQLISPNPRKICLLLVAGKCFVISMSAVRIRTSAPRDV